MISISTSCAIPRARLQPDYSRRLLDLTIAVECPNTAYPVTVRLDGRLDPTHAGGEAETVFEGQVRRRLRRRSQRRAQVASSGELRGDPRPARPGASWTCLAVTDFPGRPPEIGDPIGQRG